MIPPRDFVNKREGRDAMTWLPQAMLWEKLCLYRHLSTKIRVIEILFKLKVVVLLWDFLSFNWAIMKPLGKAVRRSTLTSIDGNEFYLFLIPISKKDKIVWQFKAYGLSNQASISRNKLIINQVQVLIGLNFEITFTALVELHFHYTFRKRSPGRFSNRKHAINHLIINRLLELEEILDQTLIPHTEIS